MRGIHKAAALAWREADAFVRRRLLLALGLTLTAAALAALGPIALKFAIDALEGGGPGFPKTGGLGDWLRALDAADLAVGPILLIGLYVFSLWASRSLGELRWVLYGTADRRLHRNLSRRLLDHVIKLPLGFHLDRKTGGLNQTLVQGLSGYSLLLNHATFTVLPVLVEIVMIGAVLSVFKAEFLLILAASVAAYGAVFALGVKQILGPSRAVSASQVDAYATLTDSLLNAETVKYFTAEAQVNARYDAALADSEANWARFYWKKSLNGLLVALVFLGSLGAATLLAARQVLAGTMTVGDFVLVNTYMLQIVRPMETLGAAFRDIAYGMAFIEKMTALMGRVPERIAPADAAGRVAPGGGAGALEVDGLRFSYQPGRPVLQDIRFTVAPGQTVALVGSTGSGKSSLIRLLMRLYAPEAGAIRLNGTSIEAMPLKTLRSMIAIVPQDTVLFNDTIAYNIAFGRPGADEAEIERAARIAQIHERILEMPQGYDTVVGERGLKLSGGEKQRVSIARAVLKRPQIFVFDEATSSLDTRTERAILDSLIAISKDMTTLVVAHRLSTVVHADAILVMEAGRIVERGCHSELLHRGGRYAAMWHAQQRGPARAEAHRAAAQ